MAAHAGTLRGRSFGALAALGVAALASQVCAPGIAEAQPAPRTPPATDAPLAPIRVSGSYWIELSPVIVAANSFYREQLPVGEGGIMGDLLDEDEALVSKDTL